MSRFIAVIHGWRVHSNGFNVHQIDAANEQEAAEKAAYLTMQRQGNLTSALMCWLRFSLKRPLSSLENYRGVSVLRGGSING